MSEAHRPADSSDQSGSDLLRASDADRDGLVKLLSIAVQDGRITAEEFSERVGSALSARTVGELTALRGDLPADLGAGAAPLEVPKEMIRVDQRGGTLAWSGRWVVPRRLEMRPRWCHVTLDFTRALITQPVLPVDMKMRGGSLTFVLGEGMAVDAEALAVRYTKVDVPSIGSGVPVVLKLALGGRMRYGFIEVRTVTAAGQLQPGEWR